MADEPNDNKHVDDAISESSSPRNEHRGKIVTGKQPNENGSSDDASDLTDHHADDEDSIPKSFPQKVSP